MFKSLNETSAKLTQDKSPPVSCTTASAYNCMAKEDAVEIQGNRVKPESQKLFGCGITEPGKN